MVWPGGLEKKLGWDLLLIQHKWKEMESVHRPYVEGVKGYRKKKQKTPGIRRVKNSWRCDMQWKRHENGIRYNHMMMSFNIVLQLHRGRVGLRRKAEDSKCVGSCYLTLHLWLGWFIYTPVI